MMNICEKVLFGLTEQAHLRLYIVAWEKTGDGGAGGQGTVVQKQVDGKQDEEEGREKRGQGTGGQGKGGWGTAEQAG